MAIVATDQITLIDITDTRSVQVFLAHNHPVYQVYKPGENVFKPNWEEDSLKIVPSVYVSGILEDQIQNLVSVEWFIDGKLLKTTEETRVEKNSLEIKKNLLDKKDFIRVTIKIVYYDTSSGVFLNGVQSMEFVKVEKGEDGRPGAVAVLEPLDGLVFRGETDRKRIRASIMIDGDVKHNPSLVKWYYAEPDVDEDHKWYDEEGGEGWALISSKNNLFGAISGYTTDTLSVHGDAVEGTETFKAVIKDSGQTVSGAVTLTDLIDNYQIIIQGNNVFKNKRGELKLESRVMLGGEQVMDLKDYLFTWHIYDSEEKLYRAWSSFGPYISLKYGEVPEKGYITCDVLLRLPESSDTRKVGTGVLPYYSVEDGESAPPTYTWIKYANDEKGGGMSSSPIDKDYIGIATNRETQYPSTNPEDYEWFRFVGDQGEQGIPGPPGPLGESMYTWIRYADDHLGNGMSNIPEGKNYIGLAANKNTEVESDDPKDYVWSKFIGEEAAAIYLDGETQIINIDSTGAVTPDKPFDIRGISKKTKIVRWEYSRNGVGFKADLPPGLIRNDDVVTVHPSMVRDKLITIRASDGFLSDSFTIATTKDGAHGSGFTILLTNESHNFPGSEKEALPSVTETDILMFFGSQSTAPTDIEVIDAPRGLTHNIVGNKIYFGTTPDMAPGGMATILVSYGKQTFTRYFSYAVAYSGPQGDKGDPGDTGMSYKLVPDMEGFIGNKDGSFTPPTILVSSYQYIGVEEVAKEYVGKLHLEMLNKSTGNWEHVLEETASSITVLPSLLGDAYRISLYSQKKSEDGMDALLDTITLSSISNTDEIKEDIEQNTNDIEQNTNDIEEIGKQINDHDWSLLSLEEKLALARDDIEKADAELKSKVQVTIAEKAPLSSESKEGDLFYRLENGTIVEYYVFTGGKWVLGFAKVDNQYLLDELDSELKRIDKAIDLNTKTIYELKGETSFKIQELYSTTQSDIESSEKKTNSAISSAENRLNNSISDTESKLNQNISSAESRAKKSATSQVDSLSADTTKKMDDFSRSVNNQFVGIRSEIANKAEKTQITQLASDINLRAMKSSLISQINISPETILIDGKKININGNTVFTNVRDTAENASSVANAARSTANSADSTARQAVNAYGSLSDDFDSITKLEYGVTKIDGGKIATNSITANAISVGSLSALSANMGSITGGSISIGGSFSVTSSGYLTATGVNLTGRITATGGTFTGIIASSKLETTTVSGGSDNILYFDYQGAGTRINYDGNAMRFARDSSNYIGISTSNIYLINRGTTAIQVDSTEVKIGLDSSRKRTLVANAVETNGLKNHGTVTVSKRELKKNIAEYAPSIYSSAGELISRTPVREYHYNYENDDEMKRVGLILDEAPVDIVSPDGEGIETYAMAAVMWKAIQEQQITINQMAQEIKSLKGLV